MSANYIFVNSNLGSFELLPEILNCEFREILGQFNFQSGVSITWRRRRAVFVKDEILNFAKE
jgi:hypothetical protein